MDALAVAMASGCAIRTLRHGYALRIAAAFGLFQAVMPVTGWLAGMTLRAWIGAVDHWIAFGLLAAIGLKMLWEARGLRRAEPCGGEMHLALLLMLALATSVDALAVGLSLSFLGVAIVAPAAVIGAVTFGLALAGVWIGNRWGHVFESRIEALGGLILIGIGIKVLWAHLLGGGAAPGL